MVKSHFSYRKGERSLLGEKVVQVQVNLQKLGQKKGAAAVLFCVCYSFPGTGGGAPKTRRLNVGNMTRL